MPLLKSRDELKKEALEAEESILSLNKEEARRRAVQSQALKGRAAMRKDKVPFCESCLFMDYNRAIEDLESGRYKDKGVVLPKLQWNDYYGKDKFTAEGEHESRKPDGNRIEVVKGFDWKCLRMGHGVSIDEEPVYERR